MSPLLTLVPACFVALAVVWPQAFGWSDTSPFALLVAMRGALAVLVGALAVLFLWIGFGRDHGTLRMLGMVALAAALASIVVLVVRGLTSDALPPRVDDDGGDVHVLAFNTLGTVSSDHLAELVRDVDADVIVLSETTRDTTERVAAVLDGDFQVFHQQPGVATHSATGLLVSSRLGAYGAPVQAPSNPHGLFTVAPNPSPPASPVGPVTVVQAIRPHLSGNQKWHTNLKWAVGQCRESPGAIVAGDFNATLDHEPMRDLGHCVDAADALDASGVVTWPASYPAWTGAPIDHILVDARAWSVRSLSVLNQTFRQ